MEETYELLHERQQQLSLDSYYPAYFGNVRKRVLFERIFGLRLARTRCARVLYVQERHARLALRKKRQRLRLQLQL